MKDRIPTYPGRVTLTPVSGQENTYDLVRADEPTEAGTALNKANLLTDAVASTIQTIAGAASAPDTPNAALNLIAQAVGNSAKVAFGTYTGTGTYGSSNPTSLTFDFEPKFLWVTNGEALAGNYLGNSASSVQPYVQMMVLRNISKATLNDLNANTTATINITWNGNTVSWYSTYSDAYQLNKGGEYPGTYTYFAIG